MSLVEFWRRSVLTLRQFHDSRAGHQRIALRQEQRLRRLLRLAADRSPFYREKFRGLDLASCPLTELPTTSKSEVMANYDRVVTDPKVRRQDLESFLDDPSSYGKLFLDKHPVCHTSGSQGQPIIVVHDRLSLDLLFAFQMTRGNVRCRYPLLE